MKLYIDPGTGSMLFSLAIGLISVVWFGARKLWMKVKYRAGGKVKTDAATTPLVIFSDDKRYWQTFEPVIRELDSRSFNVTYMTQSPDDPALSAAYPHLHTVFIGEGNNGFAKMNFLNATMVLSTTPGLDVYQWKRSKDVKYYVYIPHGANDATAGYRMFGLDFYDAVMISGEYQEANMRYLENIRGEKSKDAIMIGVPYMDELVKRMEGAPALSSHPRTVLVAPTWGASSLFNRYGERFIDALLSTGYHIILRPHPQSFTADKELMDRLMEKYSDVEWNRDTDNFEVLRRSDIMISDYSGVIFDFALVFDKPVICADTKISVDSLDAWWLNTPYWTTTAIPRMGPVLRKENLGEIKDLIDQAIEDKSYTESRHEVRDETWMCRGEGAKRAADYLIAKYEELTKEAGPDGEQMEGNMESA